MTALQPVTYENTASAEALVIERLQAAYPGLTWQPATFHEQVKCAIDGYINGVPVDIKHTRVKNNELPFELSYTTATTIKASWFTSLAATTEAYVFVNTNDGAMYYVNKAALRKALDTMRDEMRWHYSFLSGASRKGQRTIGTSILHAKILYVNIEDMTRLNICKQLRG